MVLRGGIWTAVNSECSIWTVPGSIQVSVIRNYRKRHLRVKNEKMTMGRGGMKCVFLEKLGSTSRKEVDCGTAL